MIKFLIVDDQMYFAEDIKTMKRRIAELERSLQQTIGRNGLADYAQAIEKGCANALRQAADALEAAEQRIAELEAQLHPAEPDEPHPDHCLCDDCVTLENINERLAATRRFIKSQQ